MGIPVAMHSDEKMYVPTMIFGHLLTSSNFDDEEEKVTGGRNGYGAKLCNVFSTKFTVETASIKHKRVFKQVMNDTTTLSFLKCYNLCFFMPQVWENNMSKAGEPKIKEFFDTDYTRITFEPDLAKFKMDKLDADIVSIFQRRAYDVAATSGCKVTLNGKRLQV
jgi:DNA topoisomerase-2